MAKKNAVQKIPTPVMEAKANGKVNIIMRNRNPDCELSLESDIVNNGWRYIQNDFKSFLFDKQKSDQSTDDSETDISKKLNELVFSCLEHAEINRQSDIEILQNATRRALVWHSNDKYFTYKAVEIDSSSDLIKKAIDQNYYNQNSQLSKTNDNTSYRKHQRDLFSIEPSDNNREAVLQFAFLLKMNSAEMRTYLMKWLFADDIRWDNPWELAAAYQIECHPAKEEDRASTFKENVRECLANIISHDGEEDYRGYLDFIGRKEQQEYDRWVQSYRKHYDQNLEKAFLCHWAWLLFVSAQEKNPNKVIPPYLDKKIAAFTAEQAAALSDIYRKLKEYVSRIVLKSSTTIPQKDQELQNQIIQVMKNRHLRLVAAAYEYAHLQQTNNRKEVKLAAQDDYVFYTLPTCGLGFENLHESVQKIRNCKQFSRSDIIRLGIELGLNTGGFNQLLTIGGFYELYARDFFEYTLMQTLHDLESVLHTDGSRFAKCTIQLQDIRNNLDLDAAHQGIKQKFQIYLNKNYNQLSPHNRLVFSKHEPNWVTNYIRMD